MQAASDTMEKNPICNAQGSMYTTVCMRYLKLF